MSPKRGLWRLLLLAASLCVSAVAQSPATTITVVIDPAHGGGDLGAKLTTELAEKDFNLTLSRTLAASLKAHQVRVVLLRDSDTALTPDQRAAAADRLHPTLFLSLHSVANAAVVRVFTVPLAPAPRTDFMPWHTAQAAWIKQSTNFASAIVSAGAAHDLHIDMRRAAIPLLPSITSVAIAVEAPADVDQTKLVDTITDAIIHLRATAP